MERTVFILGAGASYPYGYPLASGLTHEICGLADRNSAHWKPFLDALAQINVELGYPEVIDGFVKKFRFSETYSIDAFIKRNKEYQQIGKLAIAIKLIPGENSQNLFLKHDNDTHWYRKLFNELDELIDYRKLNKGDISFLTFNYDRSLEYYLFQKLKHLYNFSDSEVKTTLEKLGIRHVHGHLGYLPFQDDRGREYKGDINPEIIRSASSTIKLAYETLNPDQNGFLAEVREVIKSARRVYFLGFSYHPDNMEVLGINRNTMNEKRCAGTSFGLSQNKKREILQRYGRFIRMDKEYDIMGLLNEVPLV